MCFFVCQSYPVLCFTPRKQKYSPSILLFLSPHLPLPPLGFDPPLQPRWKDDRVREAWVDREGERRERDDSFSTSVEDWERNWEREKKKESAILMMSFSPWEEEETYAASRGAGASLCMHMFTAFFFTHSDWVNCRCLSSFWNVNICCHLPWLTWTISSHNQSLKSTYSEVISSCRSNKHSYRLINQMDWTVKGWQSKKLF